MATTVKSATLKVTIKEEINLNGSRQDSENILNISDINEIHKVIMSCDSTNATTIFTFDTAPDLGTLVRANVRYLRITNLDDTNYAILRLTAASSTDLAVRLDPGASYLIVSSTNTGVVDYADISGVTLEDLLVLTATSNSAAVDLEVFVASA